MNDGQLPEYGQPGSQILFPPEISLALSCISASATATAGGLPFLATTTSMAEIFANECCS